MFEIEEQDAAESPAMPDQRKIPPAESAGNEAANGAREYRFGDFGAPEADANARETID